MKNLTNWLVVAAITAVTALPATTHATNAMTLIGYGTKARGVGGVSIALPQDAVSGAANPANIAFVESRGDMGADFFFPKATSHLGGLQSGSQYDKYLMPAAGAVYNFNRKVSLGFSATPYGGGGTRFDTNLYNAASNSNPDVTLGVELIMLQMNPTVSYKVNKQNSIGASLVVGVNRFRAFGLDYFANFTQTGLNTTKLTNNGNDYSYGAGVRLGWMGQYFDKRLNLGAAYSSRVYMKRFDKYEDMFAEDGDLDTPANIGAGISIKPIPSLTLGFDITKTFYSDVRAIGNRSAQTGPGSIFPNGSEKHQLGKKNGLGFGWGDQVIYKVGAIYDLNERWAFRAGWNYGKSPVDEKNGEILMAIIAPAITQNHLTLGTTYSPNRQMEFSFSFVHAFKYEQEGPTFIGNEGKLEMYQTSLGVSFGYKF